MPPIQHRQWPTIGLLAFVSAACSTAPAAGTPPLPDRWQFAASMAALEEGDPVARVLELLGPPDDVVDPREDGQDRKGSVRWCYGTSGHGTFATLGSVRIDARGMVDDVSGEEPCTMQRGLLAEADLRRLMRCMQRTMPEWPDRDPRAMVALANAWIGVGEQAAVAATVEFSRVAGWSNDDALETVFLTARIAFDVPKPPGFQPPAAVGMPTIEAADDRRRTPRFPMHVVHDIPFYLPIGYRIGGEVSYLGEILELAEAAELRTVPLLPGAPGPALNELFAELSAVDVAEGRPHEDRLVTISQKHLYAVVAWRTAGADTAMLERIERHLIGQATPAEHAATIASMVDGLADGHRRQLAECIADNEPWSWRSR